MSSKKRSYGQGVAMSALSTGALMKKARAYEAAKAVRNRAPRIKGAIALYGGRQELKYVDTAISQNALAGGGTITPINLLAVGDDNTSRDGRQVCFKSVQLKLRVQNTVGGAMQKARVLLVWDNAVNSGAVPTMTTMLTADSDAGFPNIDNAQRFTILYDQSFALGPNVTTATQAQASNVIYDLSFYKKMNSITQYSGTTAAIGSIQNGALYLVTTGSAGSGAAVIGATRCRFTDQ